MTTPTWRATVSDWFSKLPGPQGERYVTALTHGSLKLMLYAPRGTDPQQPHRQDEVYVVVQGSGVFVRGTERETFGKGDALFVPAGVVHRFEDFTDDLVVWVIFFGPGGGEAAAE